MYLMAYWRWDNYVRDLNEGAGFNFNSNQARLHSAIDLGERLWLVSGIHGKGEIRYVLVACLLIAAKTYNPPDYKYGRYRVWADVKESAYYSADGPDISDLLLGFEFHPKRLFLKSICRQFQHTSNAGDINYAFTGRNSMFKITR